MLQDKVLELESDNRELRQDKSDLSTDIQETRQKDWQLKALEKRNTELEDFNETNLKMIGSLEIQNQALLEDQSQLRDDITKLDQSAVELENLKSEREEYIKTNREVKRQITIVKGAIEESKDREQLYQESLIKLGNKDKEIKSLQIKLDAQNKD